jgi:hypothetical protein
MSLLRTNVSLSGILLVGQLLIAPSVQAATEDHIYGGDFCQLDHSDYSSLSHANGNAAAGVSTFGVTMPGFITCPVPKLTKALTAASSMTVKVAVHDSGFGTGPSGVGVYCTLSSQPQYNNNFAVTNSFYANSSPTGVAAEKDTTLTLTTKPVDALGSYSLICILPTNSATSMNSTIYSYEVIQTY